jgi:hypothetical protein
MIKRLAPFLLSAALTLLGSAAGHADHACDDLGQPGWSTIASHEVVDVKDSAPYRVDADWYVDRTSTILPLCNYINAVGNYSLRSYSLSPEEKTERVMICRGGTQVAPYAGACPPG